MTNRQDCRFGRPQAARRVAHRDVRHQVQRLEQNVGGAVTKGMLQLVDHQAVAVAAQSLQGNCGARHIAAQALQLAAIAALAGDRSIEREAVTSGRERLRLLRALAGRSRGVQAAGTIGYELVCRVGSRVPRRPA
jgi:hypothetical protein